MSKIILTLAFLFQSSAWACKIKTYEKFLIPDKTSAITTADVIASTDCPSDIQKTFKEMILSSEGNLNTNLILEETDHRLKSVVPAKIEIRKLSSSLKAKIIDRPNWIIRQTEFLNNTPLITLKKGENISFSCANCSLPGEKTVKVQTYHPISGKKRLVWAKGKILIRSKALIAINNLGTGIQKLNKNMFKLTDFESEKPEQFYTKKISLPFYKLNKPLKEGQGLRFNDLTPIFLVRVGKPVKVHLQNSSIQLSGKAMPISSGKFGDTIQLKSLKNKKVIIGRVVDFNKVIIDL